MCMFLCCYVHELFILSNQMRIREFMKYVTEIIDCTWLNSLLESWGDETPWIFPIFFDLNHIVHDSNYAICLYSNHGSNHRKYFPNWFRTWLKLLCQLTKIIVLLTTRVKHHFSLILCIISSTYMNHFSSFPHHNNIKWLSW